jgi:hypothetical protein
MDGKEILYYDRLTDGNVVLGGGVMVVAVTVYS